MKVLRDGICYVDVDDIIYKGVENIHVEKSFYEKGEMVEITDLEDIESIMNDKYIVNYDDVCSLDKDELELYIYNAEKELNYYCEIIVNTPVNARKKLWQDKDFSRGYDRNTFKMDSLRAYFKNKEEYDKKVESYIGKGRSKVKEI